jgi:hypothetical protein
MANSSPRLPDNRRVIDAISIGVLTRTYPVSRIKAVLKATETESIRERALPAPVMVYYVLALTLCMHTSYEAVLGWLVEGLQWLLSPKEWKMPRKSAITKARQRVGWKPLKQLYEEVVQPVAEKETMGAWYRNWRVVSLDGSTLEVADTKANEQAFGRPGASRGAAAYPLLRFVGLVENGPHVLFGVKLGGYKTGETTLAKEAIQHLQKDMLCLADREFLSYKLWNEARGRGAALVWRAKKHLRLPCYRRLPDGSYLSFLYASAKDRRHHSNAVLVRVIEYRLKGVAQSEPFYRLVTTVLDAYQAPAQELAALYHERWEMETALDEFKIHLRGARLVLRSKTPDLVRQEFYGFLLTYFAIRGLMHEAALSAQEDPDRLSFANAVEVIRRKLYTFTISPLRGASQVA